MYKFKIQVLIYFYRIVEVVKIGYVFDFISAMQVHQVLTGSVNAGNHCYSIGQVDKYTFWAYGSGCDLVISNATSQPIQIISSNKNVLISALDCASNGKIACAYGNEVIIYKSVSLDETSSFRYTWIQETEFGIGCDDENANVLSWSLCGTKLLVGSSVISLWSFSSENQNQVSFHFDEQSHNNHTMGKIKKWKKIWCSGVKEFPVELEFAPCTSKCYLFASMSQGECMIKVWYTFVKPNLQVNILSQPITESVDFTFVYLMHPQPVVGFEWRKNLMVDGTSKFSNALISSCQDQICRIWVETKRPDSNSMHFQTVNVQLDKHLNNESVSTFQKAASTPLFSHSFESLSPKAPDSGSLNFSVCHFHIAATINPLSDIPLLPSFNLQNQNDESPGTAPIFTVHWLNNKFYHHQLQYNKFIQSSVKDSLSFSIVEDSIDETVEISLVSSNEKNNSVELNSSSIDSLVKSWIKSRDALFSIHPSDGSLLVWHVDWLDDDKFGFIRQPQVCFSSRIPMVFSSGDALTLCPRVILFVNYSRQQNLLHSASSMSFTSDDAVENNKEIIVYSDVKLLSKHNDGSLNIWQTSFSDVNDLSSIVSVTHSLRLCGHCFHMSGILSHPILPLLVSTASHHNETNLGSCLSELILWRMDPVGPLCYSGGLSELARVSCKNDHLFTCVAWFSLLFPNWCLGSDNKSPSTGLISLNDNKMQIYQVVVNASQILSDFTNHVTNNSTSNVISQQSSVQPGCLLHLHTFSDEAKSWGNILFLDTFDASLLSPSLSESNVNDSLSTFVKYFFVVMVETSVEGTYIHTWQVAFSATFSDSKSNRYRKTTFHMFDSSDDDNDDEEILIHSPRLLSNVKVDVFKLSTQKLNLVSSVVDICSGVGKFNLFFLADQNEHVHAAPFHLCTLSESGQINFWHCNVSENLLIHSQRCSWELWQPASVSNDLFDSNIPYHVSVSGTPVLIKAANNTLFACLSLDKSNNDKVTINVSVFECASSGGSCWKAQDLITYLPRSLITDKFEISNCHLDWLSREDGSFFLAIGYDSHIQIFSLAPKDLHSEELNEAAIKQSNKLVKQTSLDVHTRRKLFTSNKFNNVSGYENMHENQFKWRLLKWTRLTDLCVQSSRNPTTDQNKQNSITVSWARDGILIVATETEMHVFSQWLKENNPSSELSQIIKQSSSCDETSLARGLFEVASSVCPTLHQYHPLVLQELLNSGHMSAVREILIHLAVCINGDFYDSTCEQISIQLSKYGFCDQLSNIIQLCTSGNRITPLSLHDLVKMHGKIAVNFNKLDSFVPKNDIQHFKNEANLEDLLSHAAVEEDREKNFESDELDELLGIKPAKNKTTHVFEHIDLSKLEPNYFGKEHCKVIHEFLTKNQLPGLSSLDQMELMALADTLNLANESNIKHYTSDESLHQKSMNLSGGERGYAVSGSGAGSLDSCGVRFIMAMHNHLCLLNSLPSSNKAVLLKQGLGTSHFAWAYHSETEEEMLSLLPSVQRGSPEWPELKSFGVVWWIRSTAILRRLVEQLARAAFLKKNDPLDAALFYLALNKKPVLCGLYRTIKDERMHQFFQHNFSEDRWRRAALKNAFALMGKQRFEHAVAFFLLAGSVQDAAEICIEKLKDFQLALMIIRLRENGELTYHQLLKNHILPEESIGNATNVHRIKADAFVRSMAYWTLGKYEKSLNTLLENVEHEDIADVFNFYIFLRSHPYLVKNKAQFSGGKKNDSSSCETIENATDQERQLIFQTALVHLEAGCPLLALDCLSMLPRHVKNVQVQSVEKSGNSNDKFAPKNNDAFDSKPIVSDQTVDWSQSAIMLDDGNELELDWSEEEEVQEESDDASHPIIGSSIENHTPTIEMLEVKEVPPVDNSSILTIKQDVFAQHLKLTACFQVFVQELKAIANAYCADGGQLRSKLYTWLENASNVLHRVFGWENDAKSSDGLNPVAQKVIPFKELSTETEDSPSASSVGAKLSSSQAPSLHELILADNQDWRTRRDDLARRRTWLLCHHNFLRTLLSYCILHDSACGALATVKMELLLLIQESLQEKNLNRSLASPLPLPSDSIPLLTSSIVSCKTVVADPLTYLCHITRDILRAVLDFENPPHPGNDLYSAKSALLCSQAAALSTCIYQSLSDTSTPSFRSKLLKADTQSLDDVKNINCHNSSSDNHKEPPLITSPVYVAPTTDPSQWPGVALVQAMLNSESASENRTKILVLLCEVVVAVYISLLIHSLHTHSLSLLYRLVNHVLGSKMWNAVFGGGVKIPIKYTKSSSNLKQMGSINVSKFRDRLNHTVLSSSNDRRGSLSNSSAPQDSLSYREKFVPPEIGLWDWFLTKPFKIPSSNEGIEFDSDLDDDDDDDDDSSVMSSLNDEANENESKSNDEILETDQHSYSWKIMRLAIVKVVISNLQSFFSLVGFELNELSTHSPFLFAILRILNEWQAQLFKVLDESDGVPSGFLPDNDLNQIDGLPRPAMLRYQSMLEPNNTPFAKKNKLNLSCKRLWHSLIKKEHLQEIFIKYIFNNEPKDVQPVLSNDSQVIKINSSTSSAKSYHSPFRIIHRNNELVAAFCINKVNSNCIALASVKDIQEIEISDLLAADSWTWLDDANNTAEKSSGVLKDEEFLFVPALPTRMAHGIFTSSTVEWSSSSQTGQGANILMKRSLSGIRKMEAHPSLPYYVTGGSDGAVSMWEWGHQQQISQFHSPGVPSKICNIQFSWLGNKLGSVDGDGYMMLWQVNSCQNPFFRHAVHDRVSSDLCFMSSASLIATTGLSSSFRNLALWDTLLPRRSALVKGAIAKIMI